MTQEGINNARAVAAAALRRKLVNNLNSSNSNGSGSNVLGRGYIGTNNTLNGYPLAPQEYSYVGHTATYSPQVSKLYIKTIILCLIHVLMIK